MILEWIHAIMFFEGNRAQVKSLRSPWFKPPNQRSFNMSMNIALRREQEQRIANDVAALEDRIEVESSEIQLCDSIRYPRTSKENLQ